MTRILLLGLDPETVDFSDPALPPGMTIEKVRAGIEVALKQFSDRGWDSDNGFMLSRFNRASSCRDGNSEVDPYVGIRWDDHVQDSLRRPEH
jgi:hypothetical protein